MKSFFKLATGLVASLILGSATYCFADGRGEVTIIGNGQASASPEYAQVSVSVTSLCYDTAHEAKEANAVLANKIVDLLKSFVSNEREQVTASGGSNFRQTEVVYVGSQSHILCEMKWRATNTIILKTMSLTLLPDIQDQILLSIDSNSALNPNAISQTYAELSQPLFSLFPETLVNLRTQAQGLAYDDAKVQFDAFSGRCPLQDARLTTIAPPQYEIYPRSGGNRVEAGDAQTPIIPDDITVSSSWKFVWSFAPSAGCTP